MANTHTDKKRKVSDGGSVTAVKTEEDDDTAVPTVLAPPNHSNLSPLQKILCVDLLKEDCETVERAMSKLVNMFHLDNENCAANCAAIRQLGGATMILGGIMQKWYTNPVIQARGCVAITLVSRGSAALKKSTKDSGALDAIIWAMKSYPDNLQVQNCGCLALWSLTHLFRENAEYVVITLHGTDLILAAMRKFPDFVRLQISGCGALGTLVFVKKHGKYMANTLSGVDLIVAAMNKNFRMMCSCRNVPVGHCTTCCFRRNSRIL